MSCKMCTCNAAMFYIQGNCVLYKREENDVNTFPKVRTIHSFFVLVRWTYCILHSMHWAFFTWQMQIRIKEDTFLSQKWGLSPFFSLANDEILLADLASGIQLILFDMKIHGCICVSNVFQKGHNYKVIDLRFMIDH